MMKKINEFQAKVSNMDLKNIINSYNLTDAIRKNNNARDDKK